MKKIVPVLVLLALVVGCRKPVPSDPESTERTMTRAEKKEAAKKAEESEKPYLLASSAQIHSDYSSNRMRADDLYRGKRVRIIGAVDSVHDAGGNNAQIWLRADAYGIDRVICKLPKDTPELKRLTKNVCVIIDGTGDDTRLGTPVFRQCVFRGAGYPSVHFAANEAKKME